MGSSLRDVIFDTLRSFKYFIFKLAMIFRNWLSVISLLVIVSVNQTHGQCSRDVDCKGDRICDNGQCHSPGSDGGFNGGSANRNGGFSGGSGGFGNQNRGSGGNKIVHAKVEGENIYFQIAWTS